MPNLNVTEIKAFVPARDFPLSKQFYQDLGFTLASDGDGVAYFHLGNASFLLQDGNPPGLAEQLMMHLLWRTWPPGRPKWRRARSPPAMASGSRSSLPSRGA